MKEGPKISGKKTRRIQSVIELNGAGAHLVSSSCGHDEPSEKRKYGESDGLSERKVGEVSVGPAAHGEEC